MIKTKSVGLLAIALSLLLIPAVAVAQHRGRPGPGGPDMSEMHERILDRLDLTDQQRAEVEALGEKDGEAMRAAGEALHEVRQALAEAIHAAELDEAAIRDAAAAVGAREGDLAVLRAQHFQNFRAILNAEQLEELDSIQETMRMLHGSGHPGWHD